MQCIYLSGREGTKSGRSLARNHHRDLGGSMQLALASIIIKRRRVYMISLSILLHLSYWKTDISDISALVVTLTDHFLYSRLLETSHTDCTWKKILYWLKQEFRYHI